MGQDLVHRKWFRRCWETVSLHEVPGLFSDLVQNSHQYSYSNEAAIETLPDLL